MNRNFKILLALLSATILFGALFYWNEFRDRRIKKEILEFGEDIIYRCTENKQCISVEMLGCNKGCYASIHKKYRHYWEEQQNAINATNGTLCPTFPCSILFSTSGVPKCANGACRLTND